MSAESTTLPKVDGGRGSGPLQTSVRGLASPRVGCVVVSRRLRWAGLVVGLWCAGSLGSSVVAFHGADGGLHVRGVRLQFCGRRKAAVGWKARAPPDGGRVATPGLGAQNLPSCQNASSTSTCLASSRTTPACSPRPRWARRCEPVVAGARPGTGLQQASRLRGQKAAGNPPRLEQEGLLVSCNDRGHGSGGRRGVPCHAWSKKGCSCFATTVGTAAVGVGGSEW